MASRKKAAKKAPKKAAARPKPRAPRARAPKPRASARGFISIDDLRAAGSRSSGARSSSRSTAAASGAVGRGAIGFGVIGWGAAGLLLLWGMSRRAEAKPLDVAPPLPPITPPKPEPLPVDPPITPPSTDAQKLALEYRRSKQSEIPRDILIQAPTFLNLPMGAIRFVKAQDGREFAIVLEEHFHSAESGLKPVGKHKGVSVFIHR